MYMMLILFCTSDKSFIIKQMVKNGCRPAGKNVIYDSLWDYTKWFTVFKMYQIKVFRVQLGPVNGSNLDFLQYKMNPNILFGVRPDSDLNITRFDYYLLDHLNEQLFPTYKLLYLTRDSAINSKAYNRKHQAKLKHRFCLHLICVT